MALFQSAVLQKYLSGLSEDEIAVAWEKFTSHFHDPEIQENIRKAKDYLATVILAYTDPPHREYSYMILWFYIPP